jgi:hypothetical protein
VFVLTGFITFFAIFTLQGWFALAVGLSFERFYSFLPVSFILLFIIIYNFPTLFNWQTIKAESAVKTLCFRDLTFPQSTLKWVVFCIALVLIAVSLAATWTGREPLFVWSWLALAFAVIGIFISTYSHSSSHQTSTCTHRVYIDGKPSLVLLIFGGALALLYGLSRYANADDTHFVSYIAGLLSHPGNVLFLTDNIFNGGLPNLTYFLNYGESLGLFVASLSYMTGLDHFAIYYFLPFLFLLLVPFPIYYFVRCFFPKYALLSVLFGLFFLVVWATYNHMHGFFFIPRMYQGKGVLLCLFLPCLLLASKWFFETTNTTSGLLCLMLLICCAGASSTGIYLSIVTFGIGFLSFSALNFNDLIKNTIALVVLSIPNFIMLVVVKHQVNKLDFVKQSLNDAGFIVPTSEKNLADIYHRPIDSMYWLFGEHRTLAMIIVMLVFAFVLASLVKKASFFSMKRLLFVIILLPLSHPVALLIANYIGPHNLVWRLHWAIPLPLLLPLFAGAVLSFVELVLSRFSVLKRFSLMVGCLILTVFSLYIYTQHSWHVLRYYDTKFTTLKLDPTALRVAQQVIVLESENDIVLAADAVSRVLPMLPRKSQLIASGPLYWKFPYFTKKQKYERRSLQYLIDNTDSWSEKDKELFKDLSESFAVSSIVFVENKTVDVAAVIMSIDPNFSCRHIVKEWLHCSK